LTKRDVEIRRVRFRQSGGIAGLIRGCDVEAKTLDTADLRALEQHAQGARSRTAPARAPAARDVLTYQIAIETAAGTTELDFDELNVPDDLVPLLAHLSKHCRPMKP
jgi:hypothetical protein